MIKFHDVEQNTDEWQLLRCGRLTSSNLGKVMANYGKAFGDPAKKLAVNIAVQQLTRKVSEQSYSNEHMERGHEQEPLARMQYEEDMFCTVTNGGFFENGWIGCSPDGLVGDDGAIEIKSVIATTHFANIKRMKCDPAYFWQCLGNMKFTGRKWIDFISFCVEFPEDKQLFSYRMKAENYSTEFAQIDMRIAQFEKLVQESRELISKTNYINI